MLQNFNQQEVYKIKGKVSILLPHYNIFLSSY